MFVAKLVHKSNLCGNSCGGVVIQKISAKRKNVEIFGQYCKTCYDCEMEQRPLKNVNNCLNTNIYFYLETFGGKSYNLYLNAVHFFNTSVNKTFVAA